MFSVQMPVMLVSMQGALCSENNVMVQIQEQGR